MCNSSHFLFFFHASATTEIYTLSLHDALPIFGQRPEDELPLDDARMGQMQFGGLDRQFAEIKEVEIDGARNISRVGSRSEEHTSELQSRRDLVCRLLLEKKKNNQISRVDWRTY